MKKLLFITSIIILTVTSNAQNNTYPTTGNVGIGTTTPSAKLDVNGRAIIDSTLTVKDSVHFKSCLTVDKQAVFEQNTIVKGDLFDVEHDAKVQHNIRINNNTRIDNVLRVDGPTLLNGDIKMSNINTLNNPLSTEFTFLVKDNSGQVESMTKEQLADEIYLDKYDCIDLTSISNPVWNHGTNKIYTNICNLVNIGIGYTDPAYKLDVKGQGHFADNVGFGITPNNEVQVNAKTTKKVGYSIDHNYGGDYGYAFKAIVNKNTTKGLAIYSNQHNKDIFTVYGDGKMVISNATGKILQLESNGLLRARRIKVDEANWADYVFNTNYKLLPLTELENFILKNKHLPNIPTAEEIKTEGLDLSEMQRLQMEKIEELTIYTIEQDKKIRALEDQLNEIKELLKNK